MARLNRKLVLAPLAVLFASACAPRVGTTELRSADMNVTEDAPASAALRSGDARRALSLADAAVSEAPNQPWPRYHRALALKSLGETDEAVKAYREAEERFFADDPRGRQLAIYGRARALDDAGRCDEAKAAYDDHASFLASLPPNVVATFRPQPSDWELAYGAQCQDAQPVAGGPAMSRVVTALIAGDHEGALRLSERVSPAGRASGWFDYNRGAALAGLGRTDESVEAFAAAERRFQGDERARASAVYGRARALEAAGRCDEAEGVYLEYADVVGREGPAGETALAVAAECGTALSDRTAGEDRPEAR
jgi:tetratricopeptide (TPR) repeat protein